MEKGVATMSSVEFKTRPTETIRTSISNVQSFRQFQNNTNTLNTNLEQLGRPYTSTYSKVIIGDATTNSFETWKGEVLEIDEYFVIAKLRCCENNEKVRVVKIRKSIIRGSENLLIGQSISLFSREGKNADGIKKEIEIYAERRIKRDSNDVQAAVKEKMKRFSYMFKKG